jgi:hypothetical protein
MFGKQSLNPSVPEFFWIGPFVAENEVAHAIPSRRYRDIANGRFIQDHDAVNRRIWPVYNVSSMLAVFLQQAPQVFRIDSVLNRNLNVL